ncbi:MAG: hypothetical protein O2899_07430 [Bacteroidetes bacterium]|nr:hypothetical protein [Bacteroidota bacterium]
MKLYNEKEIGAILKRAAEMSLSESGPNAAGLSIEELQQVGSEAGLDPDLILRAAAEMQQTRPERRRNFFGGPVSYANDFVLDGEIDAATWEEMISAIRSTFKDPGVVSTRPNVFEWTSQSETEKAQVTALVSNGKTKMTLFWSEPVVAIPFFIQTIIGTIISMPIVFESLDMTGFPAAAIILSVFSTLFLLARFAVGRVTDREINKLRQLETSLDLIASKKALRSARKQAASLEAAAPLLDLDEPTADAEGAMQRSRTRE